ncbi:MAG: DNA-formamidopyrimidine glycosylase family protein [Caldilineaceae bacterium]
MFELPEFITLTKQINEVLPGKVIQQGELGNSPHKFVWYNRSREEFAQLTHGKTIGQARTRGKWLFVPIEPGYVLTFGECGGKVLYHAPGSQPPTKIHLCLTFADGSLFTATTQMWGAMELYEQGKELERQYIRDMRPTPVEPTFTLAYFSELIDSQLEKRSVKALLTQDQLIPGLGNALAQDILFHARLHPRHPIQELDPEQRRALYGAIVNTVCAAIAQGGRNDETDLYNRPGGYRRLMDNKAVGEPCPTCGAPIERLQYLGGACYFCPHCQT